MSHAHVRNNVIARVNNLLARRPVYLDTETTGMHDGAEIIEICIVDYDGRVLLDSLVKPRQTIPRDAIKIHNITNAMVQDAPAWTDLWPQVRATLAGRSVGIYNVDFDLRLLKQSHRQAGLTWQPVGAAAFCIMKLYAEFYGDWNRSRQSFRWQSLDRARSQCGINLPNSHRAQADTLLARAIFYHMTGQKHDPLPG
jgi:DNA polymerase-3 subunit epsilon